MHPSLSMSLALFVVACNGLEDGDRTDVNDVQDTASASETIAPEAAVCGTDVSGADVASCNRGTLGEPLHYFQREFGAPRCDGSMALDRAFAYWTDCISIFRCDRPSCTCGPEVIVDEAADGLASDGSTLFWRTIPTGHDPTSSIRSCPLADCSAANRKTLFTGHVSSGLTVDETNLYFVQWGAGIPTQCAKDDCAATLHPFDRLFAPTAAGSMVSLTEDDRFLYACLLESGAVEAAKIGTGGWTPIPSGVDLTDAGAESCWTLFVDDSDIFISHGGDPSKPVTRIARAECCPALDCLDELPPWDIQAVDANDLFYLTDDYEIMRVPKIR